jgi:hypothetical protein
MTQFAGSRSLDERRRRRLATESDEALTEAPAVAPVLRRASKSKEPSKARGPGHFPLRKIISSKLWKHSVVGLFGLVLAGALLVAGWAAHEHAARLGPGFVWLFDLPAARIVRLYLSTAMFLSSELALLVWWLRSQSLQDFKGRYRGWVGCAALGMIAAVAVQTNALRAWNETAQWLWHLDDSRLRLSWLVPLVLCGLAAWRFLYREMRDCWTSVALLWLALLFGAAAIVPALGSPLPMSAFAIRLMQCGLAMAAVLCLFMSLLLQARHAIYVTVEPPAERPFWFVSLWRRYRRKDATAKTEKPVKETVAATSKPRLRKRNDGPAKPAETPTQDVQQRAEPTVPTNLQKARQTARPDGRPLRRSA